MGSEPAGAGPADSAGESAGGTSDTRPGATIKARLDGPFLVTGEFTITDHTGATIEAGDNTVLCRCGKSANKPFCDGSHRGDGD